MKNFLLHLLHQPICLVVAVLVLVYGSILQNDYAIAESEEGDSEHKREYVVVKDPGVMFEISGYLDATYGHINQDGLFTDITNGSFQCGNDMDRCKMKNNVFSTNSLIKFDITKRISDILKYGVILKLNANPSKENNGDSQNASATYAFLETNFGKIEIGSNSGAGELMKYSVSKIAAGTGGVGGNWKYWTGGQARFVGEGDDRERVKFLFLDSPSLPYSADNVKKSNKITYMSPRIGGAAVGISYIPDVNFVGTTYGIKEVSQYGYNNVIDMAVNYEKHIGDTSVKVFATTELGQAKTLLYHDTVSSTKVTKERNVHNLFAWEIGSEIDIKQTRNDNLYMRFLLTYANLGKSGMLYNVKLKNNMKQQSNFITAGFSLDIDDNKRASITYMRSLSAGRTGFYDINGKTEFVGYEGYDSADTNTSTYLNRTSAYSLGMDYKISDGLLTYAEVTLFDYDTPISSIKSNRGVAFLAGASISF